MEPSPQQYEIMLCKIYEFECAAKAVRSLDLSEVDKSHVLLGHITELFYACQAIASARSDVTQGAGHEQ